MKLNSLKRAEEREKRERNEREDKRRDDRRYRYVHLAKTWYCNGDTQFMFLATILYG